VRHSSKASVFRAAQALERAGLAPITLSYKEGLALNNGTAQMLACGVLALDKLEDLLDTADLAAAMTIDASRRTPGRVRRRSTCAAPASGPGAQRGEPAHPAAGLDAGRHPVHLVPKFRAWQPAAGTPRKAQALRFDIGWDWVPMAPASWREKFYNRFRPFRGGKKHQPQDSYSLRCIPQVHGAVRDAGGAGRACARHRAQRADRQPHRLPGRRRRVRRAAGDSAGHFHGMPLALAMSYVKAAIPGAASISERRLNKLVDPATNDGLPGS
jgi:histidine ammonia-lyase